MLLGMSTNNGLRNNGKAGPVNQWRLFEIPWRCGNTKGVRKGAHFRKLIKRMYSVWYMKAAGCGGVRMW